MTRIASHNYANDFNRFWFKAPSKIRRSAEGTLPNMTWRKVGNGIQNNLAINFDRIIEQLLNFHSLIQTLCCVLFITLFKPVSQARAQFNIFVNLPEREGRPSRSSLGGWIVL